MQGPKLDCRSSNSSQAARQYDSDSPREAGPIEQASHRFTRSCPTLIIASLLRRRRSAAAETISRLSDVVDVLVPDPVASDIRQHLTQ